MVTNALFSHTQMYIYFGFRVIILAPFVKLVNQYKTCNFVNGFRIGSLNLSKDNNTCQY